MARTRLLIEDWFPAAAVGVESMRERGTGQNPPNARLHVWFARRPLTASRATVLGSVLPANFDRRTFERLLGFYGTGEEIQKNEQEITNARKTGARIKNPHGARAFKAGIEDQDVLAAHNAARSIFGEEVSVIDSFSGGGSIPLESARMGFKTYANELNPVPCTVLEATVVLPFKDEEVQGNRPRLELLAHKWGKVLSERFRKRMGHFYPVTRKDGLPPLCYVLARTVPCPVTGHPTPLVPDWLLLKSGNWYAFPTVDKMKGTWSVDIRQLKRGEQPPAPTFKKGNGRSLFSVDPLTSDYVKSMAERGKLGYQMYAVVYRGDSGIEFEVPTAAHAEAELNATKTLTKLRPRWDADSIIPNELVPMGDKTKEQLDKGVKTWDQMFTDRQLLAAGTLVEELKLLSSEIIVAEGVERHRDIALLLSLCIDKFINHNCNSSRFETTRGVIKGKMDRHDYAFKMTFAEMAPCQPGSGFDWALDNVLEAYLEICRLPRAQVAKPAQLVKGSATNLASLADKSVSAVVVDPPYSDNVQYSEMADFFYVWLKRMLGFRNPEWFSSYLCDNSEEAVVNIHRHIRPNEAGKIAARKRANVFYEEMMARAFSEAHRVLHDDGALTVMFTHKKQDAWEALFSSIIKAGFTITATWPVKTESEHSLHQAKKNAAQSTVMLVCRKRETEAAKNFDPEFAELLATRAAAKAEELEKLGMNPVDQLVGAFGPAMEVFSTYREVRTLTGDPVTVGTAIDMASEAVSRWRLSKLTQRASDLDRVEAEGKFYLLSWDVLQAAEFRYNEGNMLGKALGIDVDDMAKIGLIKKKGDNLTMVSAAERRRLSGPLSAGDFTRLQEAAVTGKAKKRDIHPYDPDYFTALDLAQAMALCWQDAFATGGEQNAIGAVRGMAARIGVSSDHAAVKLICALVNAAPEALRFPCGKGSASEIYPEFIAWHAMLKPLFSIEPPTWEKPKAEDVDMIGGLFAKSSGPEEDAEGEEDEEDNEG
jgi:putative DNA methylase